MLIPSFSTIRKLFQTHQNQCSLRSCTKQIIDSDGHVNGNIYFIEHNNHNKPRYNPKLSNNDMTYYHNLILLCDWHGFKTDYDEREFSVSNLREEILLDQEGLVEQNFEITEKMFEDILHNFIDYHDPDRFSHMETYFPLYDSAGGDPFFMVSCTGVHIKPTKHYVGGKFEIVDSRRKIQNYDKVIFYPPGKFEDGVQADIKIQSKMSILGKVPKLPSGKYLVSIRSTLDESSKLEDDLKFTVL